MKKTDQELNTILDDVTAQVAHERLDSNIVSSAAERVWTRIAGEEAVAQAGITPVEQIRGCEDFQALIPAYLQGLLTGARTMLLEDHTRECLPCRKALKVARSGNQTAKQLEAQQARAARSSHRMAVLRWGIAAVLVFGLGMGAWPWVNRFLTSVGTLQAIVEAAQGNVYKVTDSKTQPVKAGEKLGRGERLRTARGAGAVLRLPDGSSVEMRERSELLVNESTSGTTIDLERGNIIVQASKQETRKLFVATNDVLVSVTGTIFSVNSGTKGARVSVIEGQVGVSYGGKDQVLGAGRQITTHPSIERIALKEEIAWSRDADRYLKMLEAIRDQVDREAVMPGNRYSTRLLDLMPENTVLYVAIPNISETLSRANQILQENLQSNVELREWWEQEQLNSKGRGGLNQAIELAREFGSLIGDEIVLGAEAGERGGPQEPIVLAELKDAAGFRNLLETNLEKLGRQKKDLLIVDDPMTTLVSEKKGDFFVWIDNDLLVASSDLKSLQRISGRLRQNAGNFSATPFYAQIAGVYREGAGFVIAADLEKIVMRNLRQEKEATAAQQLGLTDLRYFIIEVKEKEGRPFNRAQVSFKENGHGITSWLAQPGPMGALEFISPDANIVIGIVVKEPSAMIDDLFNTLKTADEKDWQELQDIQAEHGIDLRNDFAATLGGEYALAIDGPLLPTPSWKAIFQVDDQNHLQQTLERIVAQLNQAVVGEGKKGFAWSQTENGGKTFYTIRSLDFNLEVNYTYAFGYMIAAPSRALVENAIKYRESGYTLLQSSKFKATLPEDKQANFSAMVYQNVAPLVSPIAGTVGRIAAKGPKEMGAAVKGILGNKAGLAYVYALNDRMIFSVNTEDGPWRLSAADLLGLPGSSGLGYLIREATR
jgi:ferric-dicitrate binding protein FerR (iron transport regulator)